MPRDERICYFCTGNKIEDENHFLLDCIVCYTAVFSVVTQRSSPQMAAEN